MCLSVRSHLIRWPQGSFISTMRVNIPTGFTNRLPDSGESQQFHACPRTSRQTSDRLFSWKPSASAGLPSLNTEALKSPVCSDLHEQRPWFRAKLPACHITHFHCLSIFPICSSCFLFGNTDCF